MKTLFLIMSTGVVMAGCALSDTQQDWKIRGFVFITTDVLFPQKIESFLNKLLLKYA